MKLRSLIAAGILVLVAAGGGVSAAYADSTPAPIPLTATQPGGAGAGLPDEAVRSALYEKAKVQTPAQAEAIHASGKPADLLVDPATGKVVAAIEKAATPSPLALVQRGPGCGTGDACMRVGYFAPGTPYGFYGTGAIVGPWSPVRTAAAGNILTTFWFSQSQGTYLSAGQSATFTSFATVVSITRG